VSVTPLGRRVSGFEIVVTAEYRFELLVLPVLLVTAVCAALLLLTNQMKHR
jgi:hypothetical protein